MLDKFSILNYNINITNKESIKPLIIIISQQTKNVNRKDQVKMEQNVADIIGHLTAVLEIYQDMNDKICEDTESGKWISMMILNELEEILADLHAIDSKKNS